MPQFSIIDRHNKPLQVGLSIRIVHCVGRYGRVQCDEGVIEEIDRTYRGLTLRLANDSYRHTRDGRIPVKSGEQVYYSLPGQFNADSTVFRCFKVHEDIEHGHEAWVEIIP
ncbi:hypothetical protein [Rubrivivax gelatinosus]|uniref:hypothetical protein n=1 Tax=Rubrivivax gelatinosus TaxID=28068 RepID=UPI0002EF826C|nr:hypothetical protein [Rubrivivax gelatinosus]MBG6083069.1 hypothetical protein [Rubrivivax gelatinosus]